MKELHDLCAPCGMVTENKTMTTKRFPTVTVVKIMYKNKALIVMSSYYDLTIGKNNRSASVALAGRARGAISAVLDFLLHFCIKTKVEII